MESLDRHPRGSEFNQALRLRNWAIALSSLATALFLFPFITSVAFGYSTDTLLTSTIAGMVACAILQVLCFLIVLYLTHIVAKHPQAQHHWGCIHLLPGIDAGLAMCSVGGMGEFIAFIAAGCFEQFDTGEGCYTPIGPVLPAVLIGISLSAMATIFISRLLAEPHVRPSHQRIVKAAHDPYFGEGSKYGTLE